MFPSPRVALAPLVLIMFAFFAASASAAPVATSVPTVSGTAYDGQTLSASNGVWSVPEQDLAFTYQWITCDLDNVYLCSNINGATSSTLLLTPAEVNWKVKIVVTADDGEGTTSSTSLPYGPVNAVAPNNTVAPSINGTPVEGETLTIDPGTWTGTPVINFSYQWLRCNADGVACVTINGSTASTYVATGADVGKTLRASMGGSNGGGTSGAFSSQSGVITAIPVNPNLPVVTGTPTEGQTLQTSNGLWPNLYPTYITYSYQWQRCDSSGASCENIVGATNNTLSLTAGDIDHKIRSVVTANDGEITEVQTSLATAVVAAEVPTLTNTEAPSISGVAVEGQTLTADDGLWEGTPEITYEIDWMRCHESGCEWLTVESPGTSYTLTRDDIGWQFSLYVTATNPAGADSVFSTPTENVAMAPPTVTTLPEIFGPTVYKQQLTADPGIWSSAIDANFTYQWQRCDEAMVTCVDIVGETSSTLMLVDIDVGQMTRVVVTASNFGGETSATTYGVGPIAGLAPSVNEPPTITGASTLGSTVTVDTGFWDSYETPDFTYQWQRCDASGSPCNDIDGATSTAFDLTAADIGFRIKAVVSATNGVGTSSATSNSVGPVNAPPLAVTLAADDITATSAQLNGTVDRRYTSTAISFRWGTDPAMLTSLDIGNGPWSGNGVQPVWLDVSDLEPSTTYYFCAVADSAIGGSECDLHTFVTEAIPVPLPDPPAPPPASPPENVEPEAFAVVVKTPSITMERAEFEFSLPEAGSGTFTGTVVDDSRHVGAEDDRRKPDGEPFAAFKRSFTRSTAGSFELPATLSPRALNLIRQRGFLRVSLRTVFTPAGSKESQVYKSVVKLRPFAVTDYATVNDNRSVTATVRTPRPGRLAVSFVLLEKASGRTITLKSFPTSQLAGGSYVYEATMTAALRRWLSMGMVRLMVKAELETNDYSARMLRTRVIKCRYCGAG